MLYVNSKVKNIDKDKKDKSFTIKKDDNKLGKRKYMSLLKDMLPLASCSVEVLIFDYNKRNKNEKIWSVYGEGYAFPEINDYLLTFESAIKMVADSCFYNEFDKFVIYNVLSYDER